MDLALKGRKAIICAASKGLGRGCAEKLAEAGVDITICARTKETLEACLLYTSPSPRDRS